MKKIIDFSLNNKFAVWILTIMAIVMGIFSSFNMKQELIPDITLPNISVITTYPGAAPDEIADEVSIPIEQSVQNLEGIEVVGSSSLANASVVQIEYTYGTDMDKAMNEVNEALSKLSLPEGTQDPKVSRVSLDAVPVMALNLSDDSLSMEELTQVVESDIQPLFEGIQGVSSVQISGQQLKKVMVDFDEKKLEQFGLTEETVQQLIQASNLTYPLGLTNFDDKVKNLLIDGNVATLNDLKKIEIPIIGSSTDMPAPEGMGQGGNPEAENELQEEMLSQPDLEQIEIPENIPTVQLGELSELKMVSEAESITRANGEDAIALQITKSADANIVEVVQNVNDMTETLENEYGLTVTPSFDQAEPIESAISTMIGKALYGILFAVIIILLFLRSIKTTLISIVSIPLSLLVALFLLYQMDISLNLLTLGALTVAVGRVIDDSIVVMENIYRRMSLTDEELRGKELVREATRQMFTPIFSSTIVTIAVFLPIGLVGGMVGEMFLPFALAIAFSLAASLVVAVTIVPLLAHSLFKKKLESPVQEEQNNKGNGRLANIYKGILDWTLNHKWITFGGSVVLLVLSLLLIPLIGVNFMDDEEQKVMMVTYSPAPEQTIEDVEKVALEAEEFIKDREGVTIYQYSVGGESPMEMIGMGGDNSVLFFIDYDKDFQNFSEETTTVVDLLNDNTELGEWNTMDLGGIGGSELQLLIYGDNKEDIQQSVDQILPLLEENEELEKVESSLTEAYDQYTLVADQEKLSSYGLTAAQVGMIINPVAEMSEFTTVKHEGEDIGVYIEVEEKEYESIDDVKDIDIPTPLGFTVKAGELVDIEEGKTPDAIERREGKMYASISAEVKGRDVAAISAEVEDTVNDESLPKGINVEFGGVTEQINESFTQLGLAMIAAVAIVYFVLVVTFGGALAPLAILFSLPFTIIGSLVALWIAGEPLSVSAMIGALMLIGIVVTNAIVLIDRTIRNEKEGLTTREALLEAGSTRLRPILMTAFATIGALIPLAMGSESGGLVSKSLGITVIGGLTSSTLLTLVIVPIVYETFSRFRKKESKQA